MATVVTRTLAGADVADTAYIRVAPSTYAGLTGLLKVAVTNYAWTGANTTNKQFDLRVPNFCPKCDTAMLDNVVTTTASGSTGVTKNYYYSVNKGVPGPSVGIEGDGSWNLIACSYQATLGATATALTVTYTVSFLNFADLGGSPTADSVVLATKWNLLYDSIPIALDGTGAYATFDGAVVLVMVSLVNVTATGDVLAYTLNQGVYPVTLPPDTSPLFSVTNVVEPSGNGYARSLERHVVASSSGTKTYTANADKMVFAFNAGKIDGNGAKVTTPLGATYVLGVAEMANGEGYYTFNNVGVTVNYTYQDMEV